MLLYELFYRYLRKPSVKTWVINQVVKSVIIDTVKSKDIRSIRCSFYHDSVFVYSINHEDKLVVFLHKQMIISKATKKLLEKFAISATINDIKMWNTEK